MSWWDVSTFETYLNENIVPRRLRWDIPPNDGLTDQESNDEWSKFFNEKGLELLTFLLQRKQRKTRKLDQNIAEIREELETYKETTEFKTLTTQLNKDFTKKDREVQQRKSKKYIRDTNDFQNDQVFKWQSQLGKTNAISTYSTPEKTEQSGPNTQNRGYHDPREGNGAMTPRQQTYDDRYGNHYQHTPPSD